MHTMNGMAMSILFLSYGCGASTRTVSHVQQSIDSESKLLIGNYEIASSIAIAGDILYITLAEDRTFSRSHCYLSPCLSGVEERGRYSLSTDSDAGETVIHFSTPDEDGGEVPIDMYGYTAQRGLLKLHKPDENHWFRMVKVSDKDLCTSSSGTWTANGCDCHGYRWNTGFGGCVN